MTMPTPSRQPPEPTSDDVLAAIYSLLAAVSSLEELGEAVRRIDESHPLVRKDEREVA